MQKIQRVEEIRNIRSPLLRDHIEQKVMELMTEYETETLDEIGCFIVLEQSEFQLFPMEEWSFRKFWFWETKPICMVSELYPMDMGRMCICQSKG